MPTKEYRIESFRWDTYNRYGVPPNTRSTIIDTYHDWESAHNEVMKYMRNQLNLPLYFRAPYYTVMFPNGDPMVTYSITEI